MKQLTEEQIEELRKIREEISQMKNEFELIKIGATAVTDWTNEDDVYNPFLTAIAACSEELCHADGLVYSILCINEEEKEIEFSFFHHCLDVVANFSYEISKLNMDVSITKEYVNRLIECLNLASKVID